MDDRIKLSYFYGKEAEQYSFYKIPKLLFTDDYFKKISVEAKVLYGLMLDRMSLSVKNQWMDEEGRAYIYYSLEDIMDALGCSNKKAISIMKELDMDAGIGLIEKKRQGQGKPTMIYLKQFMIQDVQKCRNYTSGEKSVISEVKNLHILKCKNSTSRSEENTCLEVKNIHTNKNNIVARNDFPQGAETDIVFSSKPVSFKNNPSLAKRLKANTCEWCGEHTTDVVMHQVRTLKDLDRTLPWNQHMIKINRKTLVVCSDCHKKIHLYEN